MKTKIKQVTGSKKDKKRSTESLTYFRFQLGTFLLTFLCLSKLSRIFSEEESVVPEIKPHSSIMHVIEHMIQPVDIHFIKWYLLWAKKMRQNVKKPNSFTVTFKGNLQTITKT